MPVNSDFLEQIFNKMKEDKVTIVEIFQKNLLTNLNNLTISEIRKEMILKYGIEFTNMVKEIFLKKGVTKKELIVNASNAIKDTIVTAIKKGSVRATDDEIEKRRQICRNCEYVKKTRTGSLKKCGKCGCNVKMKTLLISQKCPKGYWSNL